MVRADTWGSSIIAFAVVVAMLVMWPRRGLAPERQRADAALRMAIEQSDRARERAMQLERELAELTAQIERSYQTPVEGKAMRRKLVEVQRQQAALRAELARARAAMPTHSRRIEQDEVLRRLNGGFRRTATEPSQ